MSDVLATRRPTTLATVQLGRPTDYSPETAALICGRLADGLSLRTICSVDGAPDKSTVCRWLAAHSEFRDQYRLAREIQAETLAEECIEIVDAAVTNRLDLEHARLRMKARQWYASKLHPRVYGDRGANEPDARVPRAGDHQRPYRDSAALDLNGFLPSLAENP